jgi:hypothetical protein
MQYPTIEVPDNLPEGVQEQVAYFLADYPKSGPALVKQYLRMVTSDEYRSRSMGRSENQLIQPNRTKKAELEKRIAKKRASQQKRNIGSLPA